MKRKILEFKNFRPITKFLKKFSLKSFVNKNKIQSYMNFFELDYLLKEIPEDRIKNKNKRYLIQVKKNEKKPLVYELPDLCRLHWLVLSRKVFNTLEIGSGFSTIFIADAKYILKKYFKKVENIRCEKQFHIYAIGENKHFLNITKKRIPKNLLNYISLIFNKVDIINYQGTIAPKHRNLPNIYTDLIYLDVPSLYSAKKKFMGFAFNNLSRVPMSADILFFEFFLEPGTFILIDGRGANAEFLKNFLKRNWKYFYDKKGDCHYFELLEKPWGEWNRRKLKFCLGDKFNYF
jgi:hypothetical protein